jgi:hypothetical protein
MYETERIRKYRALESMQQGIRRKTENNTTACF